MKIIDSKIKNNMIKSQGITLISLIVSILILIILASIVTQLIINDNGIFVKFRESKEEYIKAQVKEEIELAILDIITELQINEENLITNAIITKLPNKLNEQITIDNDLKGNYKGYEYWIDNSYNVHLGKQHDEYLISYLYKDGNEYVSTTGGWSSAYSNLTNIDKSINGEIKVSTGNQQYGNIYTQNKINLTNYNTIYIEALINQPNIVSGHFVISDNKTINRVNDNGILKCNILTPNVMLYEIDISNINGEYYMGFFMSNRELTIKKVYMDNNMSKNKYLINSNTEIIPWDVSGKTTKTINSMSIKVATLPSYSYGNYITSSQINLSDYKKLCFIGEIDDVNPTCGHIIITSSKETTSIRK